MVDATNQGHDEATSSPASPGEGAPYDFDADLNKARHLFVSGDKEAALALCFSILDKENLPLRVGSSLSLLMRDLGQTEAANDIRQVVLEGLRSLPDDSTSIKDIVARAEVFSELGIDEEAEALCRKAYALEPQNVVAVGALSALLANKDQTDEALDIAVRFCKEGDQPFDKLMYFATVFGHFKNNEIVKKLLDEAQAHCKTSVDQANLDHLKAAISNSWTDLDQHGMAVGLFDKFAAGYDAQLEELKNNGPSMVYTALEELGLAKNKTRRVFDAGCGTGLCAMFLSEYSKELVGADLSTGMLEKAREKEIYDYLCRTDLSIPSTYPEGKFDMIVCADVLVYFGDLKTVFENFRDHLNPGGWMLFSVETETDQGVKIGYKLYQSGRYKHSTDYLLKTLSAVGFPKPKLLEHGRLRDEMRKPVIGTIIAVQKPALAFQ